MTRITAMIAGAALASAILAAPAAGAVEPANTIAVLPTDTPEQIIEKAANVVPTPNQLRALEKEFIAFVHFGPNTFTRVEWGNGVEDPSVFDLKQLDTDQWVRAMKAAGMKMVILTAKHHDGFVLWQSRYTDHGIMSSPFMDGKGDVVRSLAESCRKYGLRFGFYLSPADLYQIESPDGLYGNLSQKTPRTIPRAVEGRPFENKTTFEFTVDDYNEYFLNQLFELLTEYGPVDELWFDGAHPKRKGGQTYDYAAWRKLIRTLAPDAVIYGREDIRWCGNESGATRDTEWNVVPFQFDPDNSNEYPDITDDDIGSREKLMGAKYLHYQQPETDTSIREGWFYRDDDRQGVRSADDVFDIYERSVGGNATFLLNIPPNREGRLSDRDVAVLEETGRRIAATYGTDLLAGADAPAALLDNDINTFIAVTGPVTIGLPEPRTINRIALQEAIATNGERIESFTLEAFAEGQWKEIGRATNVGYKRIVRFPDVTADSLRLTVTAQRAQPALAKISAHHYASRPPRLQASRNKEGLVVIEPLRDNFGWKPHGINSADALNAGYTIHYTTDGTEPTAQSTVYTGPFEAGAVKLRAVATLGDMTGAPLEQQLTLPATDYTVETDDSGATVIALKESTTLKGIAYAPEHNRHGRAYMAAAKIATSADGKKWTDQGAFAIGNIVNDPSRRHIYLEKPCAARYVRITPAEFAGEGAHEAPSPKELGVF